MLKTGELRGIHVGGRGVWRIGTADAEALHPCPGLSSLLPCLLDQYALAAL